MDLKKKVCRMKQISVLLEVLFFLPMSFPQVSADTHSLQYLYTALTPGINFPEFTAVGLLDGEQFLYYDSNIRKMIPKTEWMQKIRTHYPDYWKNQKHHMRSDQEKLKQLLLTVMKDFKHTEVHTFQRMYGCELYDNGTTRGHDQFGYDGEDFISLDLNSGNWTVDKPQAEIFKKMWENDPGFTVDQRNYLEKECIEWLKKFVSYGREILENDGSLFTKFLETNEEEVDVSWRLNWSQYQYSVINISVAVLIFTVSLCGFVIWMKKQKDTHALTPGSPNACLLSPAMFLKK
ncbi:major histocompatibility complex class I-related gene protein-like isoform X2 [Hemibagrus wyckioides]|uniref:major histocompatibility complex class I-related gene protein-like isoform X2 n=1 Tax=Hemibagrus wyckioides TaxID=337641 RepID=UPI00266B897C|nr:major histocompatibility complex class I-related gene protein-like isoform X2 [Hemibagrus wyckioides]